MLLNKYDLNRCVQKLPKKLKGLMKEEGESIIIAGGYIRSVLAREKISDINIFARDRKTAKSLIRKLITNKNDFQAAIWYDKEKEKWVSYCVYNFYQNLQNYLWQ